MASNGGQRFYASITRSYSNRQDYVSIMKERQLAQTDDKQKQSVVHKAM
jgi:hypothetical protein